MRVIVTAGGTGGHIMPAVAIAHALRTEAPATEILFVGTDRGMEERIARANDLNFAAIRALGIKGKSPLEVARAAAVNLAALRRALTIVRSFRPDWVIGTGGYVTGMVVLAGRLAGASCAIQEQNSIPGLTNRILSRLARRVFTAFPDTSGVFPEKRTVLSGNPVREDILKARGAGRGKALLVLGGSLGAGSINGAAVGAIRILSAKGEVPEVIHQTGRQDRDRIRAAYRELGIQARVEDFIDDMPSVYRRAALAVCRCGGLTLAELSVMGIPAIMVPYPHAADDHQTANARYVEAAGGGWIIPDENLSPERLAMEIRTRLSDQAALEEASVRFAALGLGQGSESIVQEILRCSGA
ncbi:MAG: undecaprenyldiphospho-muramoylpentapeptide beta-N-acetylglucosaminyltransferase [Desulfomonilia bacterium]|jgi:UDP-N-acetylglucosamine--N-acetylmuramyl-(pentapeptide) pyrophosphoryl-undecaprenol N-acetylglucosamine transferase